MTSIQFGASEIDSLNLSDLDISALDARLEMTNIFPNIIICVQNCTENCTLNCSCNSVVGGCNCDAYN